MSFFCPDELETHLKYLILILETAQTSCTLKISEKPQTRVNSHLSAEFLQRNRSTNTGDLKPFVSLLSEAIPQLDTVYKFKVHLLGIKAADLQYYSAA